MPDLLERGASLAGKIAACTVSGRVEMNERWRARRALTEHAPGGECFELEREALRCYLPARR
jgi:hypothetical protein